LGGEYELELNFVQQRVVDRSVEPTHRLLLEHGIELEAFYSLGEPLSIFAQLKLEQDKDLLENSADDVSDYFVEREEMWLFSENILGSHVSIDVGRLNFEDDRRWWWDENLDAVRIAYERETFEITLALAQELASDRTDLSYVDSEHENVLRVIGEASWDFAANHSLQLFFLRQDDHSGRERVGEEVSEKRGDDSDARLTWIGARGIGIFELGAPGLLGYWLDAARVGGSERLAELSDPSDGRVTVEEVARHGVNGWGVDVGGSWLLPVAYEPRLFAGYAYGSREFRQTGIEVNEAGFGGVERFDHYGFLLEPDLSNLGIVTAGVGVSLLRSSSLDLVYHHYRQVQAADSLNGSRLDFELTGESRDVGQEIDLVLALEEWEQLEFEFAASALRAGDAFADAGSWCYGGLFTVRFAF
jgi:alginate production protein